MDFSSKGCSACKSFFSRLLILKDAGRMKRFQPGMAAFAEKQISLRQTIIDLETRMKPVARGTQRAELAYFS
jgi:hypothetical protein